MVLAPAITPSRLRLARQRRGFTIAALARDLGVTPRTLTNYESGHRNPDETTAAALAQILQVPLSNLTAPDVGLPSPDSASFRALSRTTATDRNRALAAIPDASSLLNWLERRYKLPEIDLPDLSDILSPEVAADALRAEWGLGSAPAPDMINLLEHHGVRAFSLGRDFDAVDAFSLWADGEPLVFLSMSKSGERGRMDAAHELGHLVRHRDHPTNRDDERDANQFASAFLMPADDFVAHMRPGAHATDIIRVKRRWRVSATAVAYRAHQLGLLTDWQHRAVQVDLSRLGYRSGEPDGIPRETSDLLPTLLQDARERYRVTLKTIADELAISARDLQQLVFGHGGLIALEGGLSAVGALAD